MKFKIIPVFYQGTPEYDLVQLENTPNPFEDGETFEQTTYHGRYTTIDEAIKGADLAVKHLSQEPIIVEYSI